MIKMPLDKVFKIYEEQSAQAGLSLRPGWQQSLTRELEASNNKVQIGGNSVIRFDPVEKSVWLAEEKNKTNLYDYFEMQGYHFPNEIITRYFLSLKAKPFVILTGISGTGKTKIAQIFADYMCQDDTEENRKSRIAFVPVRPDWMDNRGLLGYFNPLSECYHATPALRLLLEAAKNLDKPYFLILDEMNLAKVEYYFSDFLSILESRTSSYPKGEPLILHDSRETVAVYGDSTLQIPYELYIPPNVYITGTVNVDETTYMFSPKVLDRANVIEFNDVSLEYISSEYFGVSVDLEKSSSDEQEGKFSELIESDVRSNLFPPIGKNYKIMIFPSVDDCYHALDCTGGMSLTILNNLLHLLQNYHLHFGYRVVNEISRFVLLAAESLIVDNNPILDIQILQKVLPKLHGTRAKLDKPIQDLLAFCYDPNPNILIDISEEKRKQAEQFDTSACFPRSAQKLARMLRNLQEQGYASFIE